MAVAVAVAAVLAAEISSFSFCLSGKLLADGVDNGIHMSGSDRLDPWQGIILNSINDGTPPPPPPPVLWL